MNPRQSAVIREFGFIFSQSFVHFGSRIVEAKTRRRRRYLCISCCALVCLPFLTVKPRVSEARNILFLCPLGESSQQSAISNFLREVVSSFFENAAGGQKVLPFGANPSSKSEKPVR